MKDSLRPGQTIGRGYRLESLIGRGGSGEVWLAEDVNLGRKLAIKVTTSIDSSGQALERFSREARAIAKLNHPSIIQIYDVGREGNTPFIVMEFIEGIDLATLISRGRVKVSWGIHVAKQVAEALFFAHEQGIIHRDIKPSNIIIDSHYDRVKVMDFGLAKNPESLRTITAVGAVVGTPAYMAPEQMRGTEIGIPVDIYAFGATLYHLFTGKLPFEGSNLFERIKESAHSTPHPPNELRPDLPNELSDLIIQMLAPEPVNRPATLKIVYSALDLLSNNYSLPAGESIEDRALDIREESERKDDITRVANATGPGGFFSTSIFPRTQFFQDDSERYTKIQETLKFYRDHLNEEYQSLLKQANLTYRLWIVCVSAGFVILLAGIGTMLIGKITEGAATAVSTIIVYFIQKIFQQREDHYRELARAKNSHLEYGNQWLLIIQSIDSINDHDEKAKRQARLVDVLTEKLTAHAPK